jgi:hypothetical protein
MTLRSRAASLLREPLVHFMIAGALVFALLSGRAPDAGERRIVVNAEVVSRLLNRFTESFHRQPTPQEMDGLISDYVHEQVYYREALRLGLDKDDEIVVRRMRNKMIAIATNDAEAATPTDADLQKLLDKDPGRYAREPKVTFAQLYLGRTAPPPARPRAMRWWRCDRAGMPRALPRRRRSTRVMRRRTRIPSVPRSAMHSRWRCASCRAANGPGRSPRALACIWCASTR